MWTRRIILLTLLLALVLGIYRFRAWQKSSRDEQRTVYLQQVYDADVRKRLGLKKGDLVAVTATPEGVLITPQETVALRALDRIGETLREQGLTLEELIESGREERARLIEEQYGVPAEQSGE